MIKNLDICLIFDPKIFMNFGFKKNFYGIEWRKNKYDKKNKEK